MEEKTREKQPKRKPKQLRKKLFLRTKIDLYFLIAVILINVVGMIMIYSASYYYAAVNYNKDPAHFFTSQLIFVSLGIVAMLVISFFRPNTIRSLKWIALVLTIAFIFAVRIPGFGHASHGAYRWIKIGTLTLQVAEPIKLCLIVAVAGLLQKFRPKYKKISIIMLGFTAVLSVLIYLVTNNMSTALIVFLMVFFTLMITSRDMKYYWLAMIIVAVLAVIAILLIQFVIPTSDQESFRILRIRAWLNPTNEDYAKNQAFQAIQARYAIASGGFFGKGLGQSLLKFKLPEPHNDYILAIVFEELGVFGVLILTYLFVYLLYKIFRVFQETEDAFSKYTVLGVFFHLSIQIIMNYAVTLGLLPTMGVTLPFISAGGSSAFFTLAELGLVLSVSRQNEENKLYRDVRNEMESDDPYYKQLVDEDRERMKQDVERKKIRKERNDG